MKNADIAAATRRRIVLTLPLVALAPTLATPASALADRTYLPIEALDLTVILPSPPAAETMALSDDIATVITTQNAASPERRQRAILDAEISPDRFVDGMLGPGFTAANAPKTFALLRRVTHEGGILTQKAKEHWGRPRPFLVDSRIQVPIRRPTNAAYPSGHTIFAYEMAIILGMMVPDRRDALFVRAAEYGQSRIIVGVHYLTDINAGRIAGTVIASLLLESERFKPDLSSATDELRKALQ